MEDIDLQEGQRRNRQFWRLPVDIDEEGSPAPIRTSIPIEDPPSIASQDHYNKSTPSLLSIEVSVIYEELQRHGNLDIRQTALNLFAPSLSYLETDKFHDSFNWSGSIGAWLGDNFTRCGSPASSFVTSKPSEVASSLQHSS